MKTTSTNVLLIVENTTIQLLYDLQYSLRFINQFKNIVISLKKDSVECLNQST